jgi:GAF domain-containing protein/HAMP domain-containing protein
VASRGVPLALETLVGRTADQPALVASAPIRDQAGRIVGVGMFASDLTDFAAGVQVQRLGETGLAYIIDENDQVIAHPDLGQWAETRDLSAFPPVLALRAGRQGPLSFVDQEGRRWRAHVAALDNGWGIVVQQQEAELLSTLILFRRVSWTLLATGVILLSALAWITIRQAFRPIASLTDTVSAITAGDLNRAAPVESLDEIGVLAQSFNAMTAQIRNLVGSLEQRVAQRTAALSRRTEQLQIAAEVAREATAIRNLDDFLRATVDLIAERFGFYHVGIFLLDESEEYAVLQAASSEGGKKMLAQGHRLPVGQVGIVGYTAKTGLPRVSLDVDQDPAFFDNPNLPRTESEMALPLKVRDTVIGVLDVQSDQPQAFTDEDVAVLQVLADQLATGLQNMRLLDQAQASLKELTRLNRLMTGEAWQRYADLVQTPVTHRWHEDERTREVWANLFAQARETGEPAAAPPEVSVNHGRQRLAVPIRLRGVPIGVIGFHRPAEAGEWRPEEIDLARRLAERLALALENTRLLEQARRRAAQDRLISQISGRLRASLDPDTILQTTVRELGRALGTTLAAIEITGPTGNGGPSRQPMPHGEEE